MLTDTRKSRLALAATMTSVAIVFLTASCHAAQPASTAPAAAQLQPYTASDQSASAGVPAGFQVTRGAETVIQMSNQQGVAVSLGSTVIARNAAFQPGQKAANGVDLSMPYAATLPQKLVMVFQQSAAAAGKPDPKLTVASTTPLPLPATVGQCGRLVADFTGQQGPMKLMAVFCSLPLDSGGTYKNIMLLAQAPSATASQAVPTAQAIFQSYRIPTTWLQKKLAPFTAPPQNAAATAAAVAAINRSTALSMAGADNSANCFDLSVLRETPTYQLPRSCGGTRPD
jgi:hypothetical protein